MFNKKGPRIETSCLFNKEIYSCYASDVEIGVDVLCVFLRHFVESPTTDNETKQKEKIIKFIILF